MADEEQFPVSVTHNAAEHRFEAPTGFFRMAAGRQVVGSLRARRYEQRRCEVDSVAASAERADHIGHYPSTIGWHAATETRS